MSLGGFILFIVIGGVVGWLAGLIIRVRGVGLIGEIVIGVIGALIGGWLFGLLGIAAGGLIGSLIAALVGAIILIFIIRLIQRASLFQEIKDPFADIRVSPDFVNFLHGKFELEPKDPPESNFARLLQTYQQVRAWAHNLRDAVTFWSGGVGASILPVLYAILGVCALSLRRMQVAIRDKTFSDSSAKEHMVVAVIAGMMITLFSGLFTTSGVSLPPLALAFLAGYSSDAFFRVLEGVIGPRAPSAANSPAGGTPQPGAAGGTPQAGAAGGTPQAGAAGGTPQAG
jgi:uncharacterized membrane protein YeaQ/YmgE (transglycosylase-associated protein family)